MHQRGQTRDMNIQQTTNKYMKNNLGNMEQQLRWELTDGSLRLSESRLVGRIHLDIEMEMLTVFLDKVQEQKDGNMCLQEKEKMEKEICGLKAQLAQTKKNSSEEAACLKYQLETFSEALLTVQTNCNDLQVQLEWMNAVTEQLEGDLQQERAEVKMLQEKVTMMDYAHLKQKDDAMKTVKTLQASHQAQLEDSMAEIAKLQSDWIKFKDLSFHLQQERTSLLEETEKSSVSYEAQLEEQTNEVNSLTAALKEAENHSKTNQNQWQEEKSSLLQETEALKRSLLQKEQESEETERALRSQLEDLENQIQKKKKRKWYKRLFSRQSRP